MIMSDFQVAQFLQQFCGINAVFSYAVIIFKVMRMTVVMKMGRVVGSLRYHECEYHCDDKRDNDEDHANHHAQDAKVDLDPYVCNILVAVTQIVFTAVSMFLVDRFTSSFL